MQLNVVAAFLDELALDLLADSIESNSGCDTFAWEIVAASADYWQEPVARADFIIVDPGLLPGQLEFLLSDLRSHGRQASVLVYCSAVDPDTLNSVLEYELSGMILKSCQVFDLAVALHCLAQGGVPLSPMISRELLNCSRSRSIADSLDILTRREKQIFRCLEEGDSYKGISSRFNISRNTVHTHVKNIYSKLEAENKYDAFMKAKTLVAG